MSLIKYSMNPRRRYNAPPTMNPWAELDWFTNRVNRLFGEPEAGDLTYGSSWIPSVNVEEKENEILLTAELPGLAEEDIELGLENNVLTIAGDKRETYEEGEEGGRFHLVERSFGSFRRSFTLPRTVDAESIAADYEGGVLTIHLPKAAEAKSRKIEVGRKA